MSSTSWNPQRPSPDLADRPQRRGVRGLPGAPVPPGREDQKGVLSPRLPRSAPRSSASRPALRPTASVPSARVPGVNPSRTRRGPWACRPLGCAPSAEGRSTRLRQGEGPGEGGPRSSPPRRPGRPALPPTGRPPRPDRAHGGSGEGYAARRRSRGTGHAPAPRGAESPTRHSETGGGPRWVAPPDPDLPAEGVPDMARRGPSGRGDGVRRSCAVPP